MPSFDVVSEADLQEVRNAVDQANREVSTRFDFKGSNAHFEVKAEEITLRANDDFQLKQMMDILHAKLVKRGVDIAALEKKDPVVNLNDARQLVTVKQGIETEMAKKIVKEIKNSKLKVQAQIQGDQVRVTGKKRDDLQEVIAFLREQEFG
ncbi:MAG: YajQ family cyclic di-GMP-binding protein, partial [Gammaproteobacteria bacterium]|nr:YajQ family cyclic di-GMP-binding protein [Gammaproteobacteria bacterium]